MGCRKLSFDNREEILLLYRYPLNSSKVLGKMFSVHRSTICRVLRKLMSNGEYTRLKRQKYYMSNKFRTNKIYF